ncbi:hypothetical protein SNEBB_011386 [Seison nebaliae]|nr:hypothetical protein SNEBB_011386 [Seison nebaliae]
MVLYQIFVFVPEEQCEKVEKAMFGAGGGHLGNYEMCCWKTKGIGQFKPLERSQPTIGEVNKLIKVDETRMEMICVQDKLKFVIDAMKEAHPYEVPAYGIIRLEEDPLL